MTDVRHPLARPVPPDDVALLVDEDQPLLALPVDEQGWRRVACSTGDAVARAS